jgi:hypothetical protein
MVVSLRRVAVHRVVVALWEHAIRAAAAGSLEAAAIRPWRRAKTPTLCPQLVHALDNRFVLLFLMLRC